MSASPPGLGSTIDAGDITAHQVDKFQTAALKFLMRAVEYALQKLPLREPLLNHARFVDVRQRGRMWGGGCPLLCGEVKCID